MLKKFWIPFFLCVIVMLAGCDDGKQMMKPVLTPEPTPPPMPAVTFENALELLPGQRYTLSHYSFNALTVNDFGDTLHDILMWGSIWEERRYEHTNPWKNERFGPDDPQISLNFFLTPPPYETTLEDKRVLGCFNGILEDCDTLVIEIIQKNDNGQKQHGGRANALKYAYADYEVVLIENLTHPDITFEYE